MKTIFFLQYAIALGMMLSLATSCQKTNLPSEANTPPANTNLANNGETDTVIVAASQWTLIDDGAYTCNLTALAHEHGGWSGPVLAAFVTIDGVDRVINSYPLSYQEGKLWSDNSGNMFILYYESSFGEMPFRSIQLQLLVLKEY